jgi:ubiquinone/menaquinone biosynthesis C-methylase UbiE
VEYQAKTSYRGSAALEYDRQRSAKVLCKFEWDREASVLRKYLSSLAIRNTCILDAPTGTGRFLPLFSELGCTAVGLDISHDMLMVASERRPRKTELLAADCESLPFVDDAFDYVVSMRFMGHLPPETRTKVLREFLRVSQRGLIVEYPILNPFTAMKFVLGNLWYRLKTGRRRVWRPATKRSLQNELREAGLTIFAQRWVLRPWSHLALLHLVGDEKSKIQNSKFKMENRG